MTKSPLEAVSDVEVRVLLDRYRCPAPFHAVRSRFLGNIASPVVSASPLDALKALWGGELPEFDSLDAVNELLGTFEVPVIFITAYPERFLTGLRPEPAFLIAKPFQPATVSAIISQALFFERKAKRRAA